MTWRFRLFLLMAIALTMTPLAFMTGCQELPTEGETSVISDELPDASPSAQSSPMTWPSSIQDFKLPYDGIRDACGGQIWKVVCGYGCGYHHNTNYMAAAYHSIDLVRQDAPTTHSAVLAPARGIVSFVGWRNGYGWCVEMDHRNGWKSLVAHLETDPWEFVHTYDDLRQGTFLGYAGNSGASTTPHIHFSVWRNNVTHTLDGVSLINPRLNGRYNSGNDYVAPPTGNPNPIP
ncbi:MAG: M23 family metallopeptidase [Candidatus Nomurabacteria bacterium]|nr:MAG: M23 family metallopeptidase [Candidatus Nomurabacteria bacterium]